MNDRLALLVALLLASGCGGSAIEPGVLIDNETGTRYNCDRLDADDFGAYCLYGGDSTKTVTLTDNYTIIRGKDAMANGGKE